MSTIANIGDYGQSLTYTLTNTSTGAVEDISAATTLTIRIVRPDETTVDIASAFVTDGTDGKLTGTVPTGTFLATGTHKVWVRVADASTFQFTAEVDPISIGDDYGA